MVIKYSWFYYVLNKFDSYTSDENTIDAYKWLLRLKPFVRDTIYPINDLDLFEKVLQTSEITEDQELHKLIWDYCYDFYEPDTEFIEQDDQITILEKDKKRMINLMKSEYSEFYNSIRDKIDLKHYDALLIPDLKPQKSLLSYIQSNNKRNFKDNKDPKTEAQFKIMMNDPEFIDFVSEFPEKLWEYFEKWVL